MNLNDICKQLQFSGELKSYEVITAGNINTTYKVTTELNGEVFEYLLQRINKNVFKNPEQIMRNISRVNEYLSSNMSGSDFVVLPFNKTINGEPFVLDETGDFWRARTFLDCVCFNFTDNLQVVEEAGRAFGEFLYMLSGFDAKTLFIPIKNFHNTKKRIEGLERTIKYSVGARIKECTSEIDYILANKKLGVTLVNMLENGELPLHVTHNDTKCNNVIFDKNTLKALSVIDLDTIMPGLTAYDFGDGARSICCTTEEDEQDLSKVNFDLQRFERFAKGYFTHLKNTITENERNTFALSVYVLTLELATRFLHDYLNGDTYFRISYKNQNLMRARCQIALCKDIYKKLDKIDEIVKNYTVKDI
ncbi:MAG: aminoglycoside phosphotransferase family protein [Clostridia bacterium]|nr:aminoglycoside phosphotransferase family protein [Clostridia bacterium]